MVGCMDWRLPVSDVNHKAYGSRYLKHCNYMKLVSWPSGCFDFLGWAGVDVFPSSIRGQPYQLFFSERPIVQQAGQL